MPSEKLHKMLSELDPRAADHVHNQNKRKIIRHLEVSGFPKNMLQ